MSSSSSTRWFDYPVTVQPHHTDYGGVVWHGSYIAWMEEARIAALREVGIEFADLVAMGCDLPVIELSLNYRKAIRMGQRVRVRTCLERIEKVRLHWIQNIGDCESEESWAIKGQVTLVAVDRDSRRVLRRHPPLLAEAIHRFNRGI